MIGDVFWGGRSKGYGVGILVVDGGGNCPIGGGGNGPESKSGGKAGTSVILGGPLLFILVDIGLKGLPIAGAVLACTFTFPFNSLTIPVIMSWMSGDACRPFCCVSTTNVAKLVLMTVVGLRWGSDSDRPFGAPSASPERIKSSVETSWLLGVFFRVLVGWIRVAARPESSMSLSRMVSGKLLKLRMSSWVFCMGAVERAEDCEVMSRFLKLMWFWGEE